MFFERLKAEREALGMSQQALAERLGVSLRSQQNYESGSRVPDANYLGQLGAIGADVLFLVTGQKSVKAPVADAAEQALVESYRRCTPEARVSLIQSAALLSAGLEVPSRASQVSDSGVKVGNISQHAAKDGSVQVGYAGGSVRVKKSRTT